VHQATDGNRGGSEDVREAVFIMIEFLAQMPTGTMIFLTMAVLGLAAVLIVLTRLT
jgi:hypothetical protein